MVCPGKQQCKVGMNRLWLCLSRKVKSCYSEVNLGGMMAHGGIKGCMNLWFGTFHSFWGWNTVSKEYVAKVVEKKSSLTITEQRNSRSSTCIVYLLISIQVWNLEKYCESDNEVSNE